MKTTAAERRAKERYEKKFDQLLIRMPTGTRKRLEQIAAEKGLYSPKTGKPSVNKLVFGILSDYLKNNP